MRLEYFKTVESSRPMGCLTINDIEKSSTVSIDKKTNNAKIIDISNFKLLNSNVSA